MGNMNYRQLLESFRNRKVLVLGDVMIDAYLWGRVERISPEAPVPVVALHRRESRLGGAANVALNLLALDAQPILCAVIGNDRQGEVFRELMEESGLTADGILQSRERITTTKFRVIGNNTQMLRVDEEHTHDLSAGEEALFIAGIERILREHRIEVILFQDYNKGVLTPSLISRLIDAAANSNIPVCVDPKKKNFDLYRSVTLFKPNLKELKEGLKLDFDHRDSVQLESAVSVLQDRQQPDMVLLTLSEEGVFLRYRETAGSHASFIIPAHKRAIADVSGAGDTVISVAALCLASGSTPEQLAVLSNLAGGLVCEAVGVVPIDKSRLLNEAGLLDEKQAL
ncbi:MAG TPA: bifunctional ADP-heptose synthase [Bacteroidales bacterium]|nr:bifunctional ADP-heptose synthase [Bacteroidales bacterium]HSA43974.1 bifunctional ADP-heptose synthase [Bacteroidales bacterium]